MVGPKVDCIVLDAGRGGRLYYVSHTSEADISIVGCPSQMVTLYHCLPEQPGIPGAVLVMSQPLIVKRHLEPIARMLYE